MAARRERQEPGAGTAVEGEQPGSDDGAHWGDGGKYGKRKRERSRKSRRALSASERAELELSAGDRDGRELSAEEIKVLARILAAEAFATGRPREVLSLRLSVRASLEPDPAMRNALGLAALSLSIGGEA